MDLKTNRKPETPQKGNEDKRSGTVWVTKTKHNSKAESTELKTRNKLIPHPKLKASFNFAADQILFQSDEFASTGRQEPSYYTLIRLTAYTVLFSY